MTFLAKLSKNHFTREKEIKLLLALLDEIEKHKDIESRIKQLRKELKDEN